MRFVATLFVVLATLAVVAQSACLNTNGVALIKSFEGFRANFYNDAVGVRTIGYGTACFGTKCNGIHAPISEAEATRIMASDIQSRYGPCVASALKKPANNNQFSAMVSLTYNVGCGGFQSSSVLRYFNEGNLAQSAASFALWKYAGGRVLEGLVRRRAAETALFKNPSVGPCYAGSGSSTPSTPSTPAPTMPAYDVKSSSFSVTSKGTANIRAKPSTTQSITGTLSNGQQVACDAYTPNGQSVSGDRNWYRLSNGKGWVSATVVSGKPSTSSTSSTPVNFSGTLKYKSNIRESPSTSATIKTVLAAGTKLSFSGYKTGTSVEGNNKWYKLADGRGWVSATVVSGANPSSASLLRFRSLSHVETPENENTETGTILDEAVAPDFAQELPEDAVVIGAEDNARDAPFAEPDTTSPTAIAMEEIPDADPEELAKSEDEDHDMHRPLIAAAEEQAAAENAELEPIAQSVDVVTGQKKLGSTRGGDENKPSPVVGASVPSTYGPHSTDSTTQIPTIDVNTVAVPTGTVVPTYPFGYYRRHHHHHRNPAFFYNHHVARANDRIEAIMVKKGSLGKSFVEMGSQVQATRSWTMYKQCDSSWGSTHIGSSSYKTICQVGCAMSSLAMIHSTFGDHLTPATLNSWLKANGGYASGYLLIWSGANKRGTTRHVGQFYGNSAQMQSYINQGYGVIANVNHGGHWVLATGYKGNGVFAVNDPYFARSTYSFSEISRYNVYAPTGKVSTPTVKLTKSNFNGIATADVNIRESVNTYSAIKGQLKTGKQYAFQGYATGETYRNNNQWYKLADGSGYVSASYIKKVATPAPTVPATPTTPAAPKPPTSFTGKITASPALRVRSTPSLTGKLLKTVDAGKTVTFNAWCHAGASIKSDVTGKMDNRWFRLSGSAGWVTAAFVNGNPPANMPAIKC